MPPLAANLKLSQNNPQPDVQSYVKWYMLPLSCLCEQVALGAFEEYTVEVERCSRLEAIFDVCPGGTAAPTECSPSEISTNFSAHLARRRACRTPPSTTPTHASSATESAASVPRPSISQLITSVRRPAGAAVRSSCTTLLARRRLQLCAWLSWNAHQQLHCGWALQHSLPAHLQHGHCCSQE